MNVVVPLRRLMSFEPFTVPAVGDRRPVRLVLVQGGNDDGFSTSVLPEVPAKSLVVFSCDFYPMTGHIISSRPGVLHQVRLFTGAALIGALACGLIFQWSEYREVAQWIGAGVAAISFAFVGRK
jgi:hypothetical protein